MTAPTPRLMMRAVIAPMQILSTIEVPDGSSRRASCGYPDTLQGRRMW